MQGAPQHGLRRRVEDVMAKALFLLPSLILAAMPATAATYGDMLLASAVARHPDITSIAVEARGTRGAQLEAHYGTASPKPISIPLADVLGEPIGTISISFRHRASTSKAARVAAELSRRIYTPDNLSEPDPFVTGAARSLTAQRLVDRAIDAHPRLVTLAMHVALKGRGNQIIASNFGRIGKAADKDDAHVIADGAVLKETTNGGKRLAVELPMLDTQGHTIGALSTSFTIDTANNADAATAEATQVRDDIARRVPSLDALAN